MPTTATIITGDQHNMISLRLCDAIQGKYWNVERKYEPYADCTYRTDR